MYEEIQHSVLSGDGPSYTTCRLESELTLFNQAFRDLAERFSWGISYEVSALRCSRAVRGCQWPFRPTPWFDIGL